jgi:allantoate deiminase
MGNAKAQVVRRGESGKRVSPVAEPLPAPSERKPFRYAAASTLVHMLDQLGQITDTPGQLARTFLSPAMRRANRKVGTWMRAAGLGVREDRAGNLIGRLEGNRPRAKTLVLGSHLDTVRNAGRFDGALGVLLPIVALTELRRRGRTLPFAVEVLGFSEEEGVRFASAYLGSKAFAGKLRRSDLAVRDADGRSALEVLRQFNGGHFTPPPAAHRSRDLLGYCEVHIEQGPVLEKQDLAVGIVSAIAGQTRGRVTFVGKAGHAGTTPMTLRQDALAGAAEFILRSELVARKTAGLVATVGTIQVAPGAPNVIPGSAVVSLDVRHAQDSVRLAARRELIRHAMLIAKRRGLRCRWEQTQDGAAVACSPKLSAVLEASVRSVQGTSLSLVSGAGHDAVVMATQTPSAMLFVRCRDGLSHHPDEHVSRADLEVALRVTIDFLERLAEGG